jgi:hypothetical protein
VLRALGGGSKQLFQFSAGDMARLTPRRPLTNQREQSCDDKFSAHQNEKRESKAVCDCDTIICRSYFSREVESQRDTPRHSNQEFAISAEAQREAEPA